MSEKLIRVGSLSRFIKEINNITSKIDPYLEILEQAINDFNEEFNNWIYINDNKDIRCEKFIYSASFLIKEYGYISSYLEFLSEKLIDSEKERLQNVIKKIELISRKVDIAKDFMHDDDIFEKIKQKKKNLKDTFIPLQFYYRGEASVSWHTLPSALRDTQNWNRESFFYHEIQVRCPKDFENQSYLGKLVTMQHYGTPTRLLDITSNSLNALYFACEDKMKDDGRVLLFPMMQGTMSYGDSDRALMLSCLPHLTRHEQDMILNEINSYQKHTYKANPITPFLNKLLLEICSEKPAFQPRIEFGDLLTPLFVQPNMTNPRIVNQQGAFLLSGLCNNINEAEKKIKARIAQTQIIIPKRYKKQILKELDSIGINKGTIYPNMEKIADYLKSL